jgi:hypothetical protein
MSINDGGKVFPTAPVLPWGDQYRMTLRDWFAGQALAGLLRDGIDVFGVYATANDAYKMADAMLKAREVKP